MPDVKPITMEGDTFKKLKTDMTATMNRLIYYMQKYGSHAGVLNVQLSIDMLDALPDDEGQPVRVPKFTHKVTSKVQIKDEAKGQLVGFWQLEEDGEGGYQLRPTQEQTDMFDEDAE